ncbi:deoxyribonuclease-2-beta-like [Thunnus albacares]|uniref:deoxyribonuclease-2-beta-like n=1 Tax=Thunnus albacares TaxID=8236 RepID=UPI001CF63624|nr:deoxyribonuclease-2-beta-like [Thunnus albacares]
MSDLRKEFLNLKIGAHAESGGGRSGVKDKRQKGGGTQPANDRKAFKGPVTCRDEDNHEVDWYILYKTPRNQGMTGLDYIYIYPDQRLYNRVVSRRNIKPINDPNGILANTLKPLFCDPLPPNFGFISYNDQPPEPPNVSGSSASSVSPSKPKKKSVSSSYGHSKGVVMVQKDDTVSTGGTGVWLLHSTPQFPYKRDPNNFWPESGTDHAQIFICVTFNYNQFKHIGKHLQLIRAYPFDSHFPQTLNLNELHEVTTRKTKNHNTLANNQFVPKLQLLKSRGGKKFHSIAKQRSSTVEDGDLYVTISKTVNSDVNVQSWGCQTARDGSFCPPDGKKVQNIQSVKTDLGEWEDDHDHSKWCVAVDRNKTWTCIADVNRAKTQYERLGGALCVKDAKIRKIFKNFVKSVDRCPAPAKMDIGCSSYSHTDTVKD